MYPLTQRFGLDVPSLRHLRSRFDRLFEDLFEDFSGREENGFLTERGAPAVNLWEDDKNLYAECELPGIRLEDVDLSVIGNELRLRGEWKEEKTENATYHRLERRSGSFQRILHLPVDIDGEKVSAELKGGVLSITMPKSPAALPRKIQVKALKK